MGIFEITQNIMEIKFRAKRKDNGKWVYGDLIHGEKNFNKTVSIIDWTLPDKMVVQEVDPVTVCQLAETHLKYGKPVDLYVGDIVNYDTENGLSRSEVVYKESNEDGFWISGFAFRFICFEESDGLDENGKVIDFKIIGNVFDNPELA